MIILGLDCAGAQSSVAIMRDGIILADILEPADTSKADQFLPLIENTITAADLEKSSIDRIAVNTGPGSFTGIRIALAAAQGLALGWSKPVFGIDAFALWNNSVNRTGPLIVVIESRRAELYVKAFAQNGDVLLPAQSMLPEQIAMSHQDFPNAIFCGDGMTHLQDKELPIQTSDHTIAAMAAFYASVLHNNQNHSCTPTYVRDADVSTPKPVRA